MKKIIYLAAAFGLLTALPAFSETSEVVVSNVQGDVQIQRGTTMMPVTAGMTCQQGDIVKTGANCSADVTMNKLAGVRLLASSSGTITSSEKESMMVTINSGNAILNLNKLPKDSTFKVETPTAIAAVRGTQFWGRVGDQKFEGAGLPKPYTTFAVRQGSVEILAKNANKQFTLQPGEALDIPQEAEELPGIRKALPEEMKAMEQADSIKKE